MLSNLDNYLTQVYNKELLTESVIKELCEKTKEILLKQGNLRQLSAPLVLVGDVHGQFYDVLEIFK
jgi:serine/threonine-protein phosphatase PPG1